ncbi:PepSY domain-containing protein [Thorsellia anophelis]|uniref:Peptidase propeptide and YPEB domain-containing protein n=1 Tax=Thorsellia anophelis DSM 18579 TaxID=1123402 RepID=A0A1I0B976_9GAMM|nr:PepSY domain-containing protein [Thorsellia anophelis]SET03341.1 Peptidase propeptide and YPEB domain-containing protein [Thorsellia anophelis DSM 18579]
MSHLLNRSPKLLRTSLFTLGTLALFTQASMTYAIDYDEMPYVQSAIAAGEVLSINEIATIANKAIPGHISGIELDYEYNILAYEVKIITPNGAKRKLDINAKTGEILSRF